MLRHIGLWFIGVSLLTDLSSFIFPGQGVDWPLLCSRSYDAMIFTGVVTASSRIPVFGVTGQ